MSSDDLANALLLWRLLGITLGAAVLLVTILQIIQFFKKSPSTEQVIAAIAEKLEAKFEHYALHRDVISMEVRIGQSITGLKDDFGDRMKGLHESLVKERDTNRQLFLDIMRTLGPGRGEAPS